MTEGPYSDQCRNSARQGRSGEAVQCTTAPVRLAPAAFLVDGGRWSNRAQQA